MQNDKISFPMPDWGAIRSQSPDEAVKPLTNILKAAETMDDRIEDLTRRTFAVRGIALKIAWDKKVWECVVDDEVGQNFRSGDRWLKVVFPRSWRYCREALATISKLPEVPMEQLVSMPRCNMVMLANDVSSSVRALPDVLEAAQTLSEDEFAAKLTKDHGQALERPLTLKLTYPSGDMAQVKTFLGWVAGKADLAPDDYAGSLLYLAIHENSERE